jgi:hypothetical protein
VKFEKWITYDYEYKKFSATQFASELERENTTRRTNLYDRSSKTLSPELGDEDIKMGEAKSNSAYSQVSSDYHDLTDVYPSISD